MVVGPHAVLGGCIPRCGGTRTGHYRHGPGTRGDDGQVVCHALSCVVNNDELVCCQIVIVPTIMIIDIIVLI